ncbi:hypothetical protein NHF48_021950 [Sphingomonas sp. H160509]|uniref:hypothetical protein n=1 Tax=Sphingomonas sp. H160509 TaxID=2955313 RepID=UPI002096E1A4|nr:hypothetical protein [Sphingomonas sp. H160509]MDD1452972.1 hypothetical protein [Sphingomonas sp. H160509]
MHLLPDTLDAGSAYPLGATFDGLGVNFAVYSANAEKIELCVYDETGRRELKRYPLPEWTDEVWHGYLPDAQPGLVYGYRAHGRYAPRGRSPLQPEQALARSVRQADDRRTPLDRRDVRLPGQVAARGPELRQARQRADDAQGRRDRQPFRLVARRAPEYAVVRDGHL